MIQLTLFWFIAWWYHDDMATTRFHASLALYSMYPSRWQLLISLSGSLWNGAGLIFICAYARNWDVLIGRPLMYTSEYSAPYLLYKFSSIHSPAKKGKKSNIQYRILSANLILSGMTASILEFCILMVPKNGPKFDTYRLLRSCWIILPTRHESGYFCRLD